jgi:UDP-galactose transporter B1
VRRRLPLAVALLTLTLSVVSVPFKHIGTPTEDKFKSPLFLGTCQSFLSSISALIYLLVRARKGTTWNQLLGLEPSTPIPSKPVSSEGSAPASEKPLVANAPAPHQPIDTRSLLLRYLQCAVFITTAAPFGFAALSYISYPTMVLGKSCKLVPVMIMNVLLYRRRFAPHKYLVVAMVTTGITAFMAFGDEQPGKSKKRGGVSGHPSLYANLVGTTYLIINLAIDGATNSTQDEIFTRYKVSGQQMMLWINLFSTLLTTVISVLPLPYIPVIHPSPGGHSELAGALNFVRAHPSVITPLWQFALTGALGQIFIFETLQHFGSLTLVYVSCVYATINSFTHVILSCSTITLTRKLFTMVLSVVIYNHTLTLGQWFGTAVVFAGISVEAWVKRRGTTVSFVTLSSFLLISFVLSRRARETCGCRAGESKD